MASLPVRQREEGEARVGEDGFKVFGGEMKKDFLFAPEWTNLNHGSYGTIPRAIQAKHRSYQDDIEARPDPFIRFEHARLTDESRAAVASVVNAPVEAVVFVNNATEGVNTVFRNIKWDADGKDVALYFSTVYESCGKVIDFLYDYHGEGRLSSREIEIAYPIEDDEILRRFRETVKRVEGEGKRAKICIFDVVSSRPGVVFPWERMVAACRELGVLSLVDGAQGIGMVRLDLGAADPDFFVSNCHKWLFTPRGCAVFYVPVRNQHLLPSTLATSHGYASLTGKRSGPPAKQDAAKSFFVNNFEFTGTRDYSPSFCVKDAVAYRRDVLGGEERILAYLWDLNKKGSRLVAERLGTEVLENSKGTLTNCAMANIALPLWRGEKGADEGKEGDVVVAAEDGDRVVVWMMSTMARDYNTIVPMFWLGRRFWVRMSAQVYLDLGDYEYGAETLGKLVERVGKGEYKSAGDG
ncbi:selenocysteine lyase-like protein [Trichoderma citrinoviride]|uniref:Selenocysteine lyase-like protein n=1 Tax=Trichoderma citrinoviride TaxID=58853 RepID=A0A2T4B8L5_9HYPO|nr:selenocysteine lyase-like protein [Trichoderma citrinoviride]PTB65672.1 selenocysteine lyase-like protein [Trichoderma citrinoviride]